MFSSESISKLRSWYRSSVTGLHGLLSPASSECAFCRNRSAALDKLQLCPACREIIPWIREVLCDVCGRYEKCYDCGRRTDQHFVMNRSCVVYDPAMKDLLALYKYRGQERLQMLFIGMLCELYIKSNLKAEVLTYTPLSSVRLAERGFNQAEQLARGIGSSLGIPVVSLLSRPRHTEKQSFKTRKERLQTMEGVFHFEPEPGFVARPGLKIAIIDDVYTTGSTLNQCAKVLKESTAAEVYGLSWAR
ncbi:ComF family protein [Paenibacillus gansuensis]|uniref:ComF family protein n=1 Tax=Paenibacillus gansuensis TaxID=306542 RepID=A0ABW5PK35_9BACL